MNTGMHWVHEAVVAVVLAVALVVVLAVIDESLAAVVAMILTGMAIFVVPIVSIHYDRHPGWRVHH